MKHIQEYQLMSICNLPLTIARKALQSYVELGLAKQIEPDYYVMPVSDWDSTAHVFIDRFNSESFYYEV